MAVRIVRGQRGDIESTPSLAGPAPSIAAVAVLAAFAVLTASCEKTRPDVATFGSYAAENDDASVDSELDLDASTSPPALDASGLCGNQVIGQLIERPTVYFIIDRSASMEEIPPGETVSKFNSVRIALRSVLQQLGHRVRYGAAVFPSKLGGCNAGTEIFETRDGDPVAYVLQNERGPVLSDLLALLDRYSTDGSTPIAATLEQITPILEALPGRTVAILATDGEPNCGAATECAPEDCHLVLSNYTLLDGRVCSSTLNCCDPNILSNGFLYCIDEAATAARLEALASLGIDTYVIGLPGTEASADLLNSLARAGDAANHSASYFPVKDTSTLVDALRGITASVSLSCTIELETEPPAPSMVNLYFDGVLIPADPDNGWVLSSGQTLEVRGAACARLTDGDVYQVQIVAGCPTVVY